MSNMCSTLPDNTDSVEEISNTRSTCGYSPRQTQSAPTPLVRQHDSCDRLSRLVDRKVHMRLRLPSDRSSAYIRSPTSHARGSPYCRNKIRQYPNPPQTERDPFDASSKGSRSSSRSVSSGELRLQLFDALFALLLLLSLLLVVELLTSGLGCSLGSVLLSLELGQNLVERATHDGTVVLGHQGVERCGVGLVGLRDDGVAARANSLAGVPIAASG